MKRTHKRLTPDEARRAIYIDFEGRQGVEPFLLGALLSRREGRTEQLWFAWDHRLRDRTPAGVQVVGSLDAAIAQILARSERGVSTHGGGRRIVSFSIHEREMLTLYGVRPGSVERFDARWCNALGLAKRWRRERHPEMPIRADAARRKQRLADYLRFIEHQVPPGLGDDVAADAIRRIERALARGLSVDDFRRRTTADWERLLGHNQHDCLGLRELCLRASGELGD